MYSVMSSYLSASIQLAELDKEILRLRIALRFYADPTTWEKILTHPGDDGHHPHNRGSYLRLAPIELDNGDVARKALGPNDARD
jgi:hypothetical protein